MVTRLKDSIGFVHLGPHKQLAWMSLQKGKPLPCLVEPRYSTPFQSTSCPVWEGFFAKENPRLSEYRPEKNEWSFVKDDDPFCKPICLANLWREPWHRCLQVYWENNMFRLVWKPVLNLKVAQMHTLFSVPLAVQVDCFSLQWAGIDEHYLCEEPTWAASKFRCGWSDRGLHEV